MHPVSLTVHQLPPSHWHATLQNFDWSVVEHSAKAERQVEKFISDMGTATAPHLLLVGSVGSGKTHLAVALYRAGVWQADTSACIFVHVPSFCDCVKASFDGANADDPWERVEEATHLVVLDDLFGRHLSKWERSAVLFRLIDAPYRNHASIVITDNMQPTEWIDQGYPITAHELSRVREKAAMLIFTGEDRRMKTQSAPSRANEEPKVTEVPQQTAGNPQYPKTPMGALQARKAGFSWAEVARLTGYSSSQAARRAALSA